MFLFFLDIESQLSKARVENRNSLDNFDNLLYLAGFNLTGLSKLQCGVQDNLFLAGFDLGGWKERWCGEGATQMRPVPAKEGDDGKHKKFINL